MTKNFNNNDLPEHYQVRSRDWNYGNDTLVPIYVPFSILDDVYHFAVRLDDYHLSCPEYDPTVVFLNKLQITQMKATLKEFFKELCLGTKSGEEVTSDTERRIQLLESAVNDSKQSVDIPTVSSETASEEIKFAVQYPRNSSLSCPQKFFRENCTYHKGAVIKRKLVREAYTAWCFNEKVCPMSRDKFFKLFESHVCSLGIFRTAQDNFSAYQNLSLKR